MRQRVATLEPGTVVLFGVLYVDAAGVPYLENYALSELHAASSVPIFSFYESELGLGTVGGALLGNVESAAVAANIASRMLRGEWTNDDRLTRLSLTAPRFDWRELKRWNIDEASLPPGSEVLFRPPTIWEEHKRVVLAGLALFVVQTGLILALVSQRARRRRAEGESSALSGRLLTVHEDERRRLARELHDDVTATPGAPCHRCGPSRKRSDCVATQPTADRARGSRAVERRRSCAVLSIAPLHPR